MITLITTKGNQEPSDYQTVIRFILTIALGAQIIWVIQGMYLLYFPRNKIYTQGKD